MRKCSVVCVSVVFGACVVFFSRVDPLLAQEPQRATEIFEIIVTAPRVAVHQTSRPMGAAGVSMSYAVGYADLDLTRQDGRTELEERVRVAAEEICEFLTERYPSSQTSAAYCTRQALRDAMQRVQQAITAASR